MPCANRRILLRERRDLDDSSGPVSRTRDRRKYRRRALRSATIPPQRPGSRKANRLHSQNVPDPSAGQRQHVKAQIWLSPMDQQIASLRHVVIIWSDATIFSSWSTSTRAMMSTSYFKRDRPRCTLGICFILPGQIPPTTAVWVLRSAISAPRCGRKQVTRLWFLWRAAKTIKATSSSTARRPAGCPIPISPIVAKTQN